MNIMWRVLNIFSMTAVVMQLMVELEKQWLDRMVIFIF